MTTAMSNIVSPEVAVTTSAPALVGSGGFLLGLSLALAIGVLIGIERGWTLRHEKAGARVAGVRTFSSLGLLGGLFGLGAAGPLQGLSLVLAAGAIGALLLGYVVDMRKNGNVSVTSAVAGVATLALGATATGGHLAIASVGAGATVALLSSRDVLHRALAYTSEADLKALVRLVLVVFVILPLLPDAELGPYALNPRRLWFVVVITGSISFIGYVLIRWLGGRRGVLVTALVGGLVSSTAVTLESARRIRADSAPRANQAAIAVASAVMLARAACLVVALVPTAVPRFLPMLMWGLAASAIAAGVLVYRARNETSDRSAMAVKPPDLKLAFLFAGLVALLTTAAGFAKSQFGEAGSSVVIAAGGLFDVDSAIAAIGTLPAGTLSAELVAFTLIAPVVFNTILKLGLTVAIAGRRGALVPGAALAGTAAVLLATIATTVFVL